MAIRVTRFLFLLAVSWTVMTFTHEMGHIIGGMCCGGSLKSADLLPWHLPYSIFEPDPLPLVTLWAGLIIGALAPVVIAMIFQREWMWFVANFCVLANGAYITTAWFSGDRYLDTPRMLEHGASPVAIAVYSLATIGFGYVGFRRSCVSALSALPVGGYLNVPNVREPEMHLNCRSWRFRELTRSSAMYCHQTYCERNMHTYQSATFRWAWSLILGLFVFVLNAIGVWFARRSAFEVNAIQLSALWYVFALFPPGLSVVLTILVPRTHCAWNRDHLFIVLNALMLGSFVHIPAMYIYGGFN